MFNEGLKQPFLIWADTSRHLPSSGSDALLDSKEPVHGEVSGYVNDSKERPSEMTQMTQKCPNRNFKVTARQIVTMPFDRIERIL